MNKNNNKTIENLLASSLKEQVFYRIECEYFLSVLDEIRVISRPLEQKIINNAIERYQLDKLIHAKLLFGDNPDSFKKDEEKK